ncbi:inositol polyphosphate kinase kcs1 [Mucor circinelloides]
METNEQNGSFDPKCITSGIPLLPFTNQVGGHTPFFRFSKRAICKPAAPKEQEFYVYLESNHPELLPFLSQYLGLLNATYYQDSRALLPEVIFDDNEQLLKDWYSLGNMQLDRGTAATAATPDILNDDFQQWSPNADECNSRFTEFRKRVLCEVFNPSALRERMKLQHAALEQQELTQQEQDAAASPAIEKMTIQLKSVLDDNTTRSNEPLYSEPTSLATSSISSLHENQSDEAITSSLNVSCKSGSTTSHAFDHDEASSASSARWQLRRTPTNPWGQQVYERDRLKLQQLNDGNVVKQFILLEDLTDNIQCPCVLDLKMGNRHYGVFSNEVKMKSQMSKCMNSTSHKLGVRICGMQVYKRDEKRFDFHDKYMGRLLDENGFKKNLVDYLDGRLDHIPVLLKKLNRLARIIRSLKGYRFYASSLLLIYDGSKPENSKDCRIDVRMIDFAKCVSPDDDAENFTYPPENPNRPDEGYLLGISSLIEKFTEIHNEQQQRANINNTVI